MILIDRDALEKAIYEWMPKNQEEWMDSKIPPIENLVVSIMMTIQEQQPVEAIPIDFIKKKIDEYREKEEKTKDVPLYGSFQWLRVNERLTLESLLLEWYAEPEET